MQRKRHVAPAQCLGAAWPVQSGEEGDDEGPGEPEGEGEGEEGYWDEEDEIENYLKDRFEGAESSDEEGADADADAGRADDSAAPRPLGDNPTLAELDAETQRILRRE